MLYTDSLQWKQLFQIWKSTDVYLNDYLLHFYFDDQSVETAVEQLESTINDNEGDVQQIVGIFFELGLWSGALKKEKIVKSRVSCYLKLLLYYTTSTLF